MGWIVERRRGLGLVYSPYDGGYYWQTDGGAGDLVSVVTYRTRDEAVRALATGKVRWMDVGSEGKKGCGEFEDGS